MNETTETATARLLGVAVCPPQDSYHDHRHVEVVTATVKGKRDRIVFVHPDTAEQRDRAEAAKRELLPHPMPRLGSRARIRAAVRIVEGIAEACGWQLQAPDAAILAALAQQAAPAAA